MLLVERFLGCVLHTPVANKPANIPSSYKKRKLRPFLSHHSAMNSGLLASRSLHEGVGSIRGEEPVQESLTWEAAVIIRVT